MKKEDYAQFRLAVKHWQIDHNCSRAELAERCGFSYQTVKQVQLGIYKSDPERVLKALSIATGIAL